ncbi:MAG: group 1 truncated hemoglobin [Gammaproteobacteria bacterium]|nr:MAG: group 1 truncated hemoglobin [Gammaproteobacteria bacterium]
MAEVMEDSLYESIGGAAAVDAAVDLFYEKVLADEWISGYFETVNMARQRNKQKAFLTFAFGGQNNYTGKDMRKAHAHMNLSEGDFDAVLENLGAALQELNVPEDLIARAAAVAMSVKDDVLNR